MATNKSKVQPDPEFKSDAQKANQAWTATTGEVADSAGDKPTGPRKKTNAGPAKTAGRRKTDRKRSGA